jgi:hypothetical protein
LNPDIVYFVLSIILSLIIDLIMRNRRSLGFKVKIHSERRPRRNTKSGLNTNYEEQPINDTKQVEVSIVNTGNEPIQAHEFDRNLEIVFNRDARILDYQPACAGIKFMMVESEDDPKRPAISPMLLNPGDVIHVMLLVEKYRDVVAIDGRIAGIKRIKYLGDRALKALALGSILLLLMSVIIPVLVRLPSDINAIFRGSGIAILVSLMGKALRQAGRINQARIVTLIGSVVLIMLAIQVANRFLIPWICIRGI